MDTKELQNSIIQKVLNTDDNQLLDYLNQLLNTNDKKNVYQLSDMERSIITDSQAEYEAGDVISNEKLIARNDKWLKE